METNLKLHFTTNGPVLILTLAILLTAVKAQSWNDQTLYDKLDANNCSISVYFDNNTNSAYGNHVSLDITYVECVNLCIRDLQCASVDFNRDGTDFRGCWTHKVDDDLTLYDGGLYVSQYRLTRSCPKPLTTMSTTAKPTTAPATTATSSAGAVTTQGNAGPTTTAQPFTQSQSPSAKAVETTVFPNPGTSTSEPLATQTMTINQDATTRITTTKNGTTITGITAENQNQATTMPDQTTGRTIQQSTQTNQPITQTGTTQGSNASTMVSGATSGMTGLVTTVKPDGNLSTGNAGTTNTPLSSVSNATGSSASQTSGTVQTTKTMDSTGSVATNFQQNNSPEQSFTTSIRTTAGDITNGQTNGQDTTLRNGDSTNGQGTSRPSDDVTTGSGNSGTNTGTNYPETTNIAVTTANCLDSEKIIKFVNYTYTRSLYGNRLSDVNITLEACISFCIQNLLCTGVDFDSSPWTPTEDTLGCYYYTTPRDDDESLYEGGDYVNQYQIYRVCPPKAATSASPENIQQNSTGTSIMNTTGGNTSMQDTTMPSNTTAKTNTSTGSLETTGFQGTTISSINTTARESNNTSFTSPEGTGVGNNVTQGLNNATENTTTPTSSNFTGTTKPNNVTESTNSVLNTTDDSSATMTTIIQGTGAGNTTTPRSTNFMNVTTAMANNVTGTSSVLNSTAVSAVTTDFIIENSTRPGDNTTNGVMSNMTTVMLSNFTTTSPPVTNATAECNISVLTYPHTRANNGIQLNDSTISTSETCIEWCKQLTSCTAVEFDSSNSPSRGCWYHYDYSAWFNLYQGGEFITQYQIHRICANPQPTPSAPTSSWPASDNSTSNVTSAAPPVNNNNSTAPPMNSTASPMNSTASSMNSTAPPMNSTASPMNSTAPPMNSTAPPMNSTAPPMNSTAPPMNSTAPPMNSTAPPMNSTAPPMNYTAPPMNSTASPMNFTAPPMNSTAPPINSTAPMINVNVTTVDETTAMSMSTNAPSRKTTPLTTSVPVSTGNTDGATGQNMQTQPLTGMQDTTNVPTTGNAMTGTITTSNAMTGTITTSNAMTGTITTSNAMTGTITTSNAMTGTITTSNAMTGTITTSNAITVNPTTGSLMTGNPTTGNPMTENPTTAKPMTENTTAGVPITKAAEITTISSAAATSTVTLPPSTTCGFFFQNETYACSAYGEHYGKIDITVDECINFCISDPTCTAVDFNSLVGDSTRGCWVHRDEKKWDELYYCGDNVNQYQIHRFCK